MTDIDLAASIIDDARHALSPERPGPRIEPTKAVLWSDDASRIVREWEGRKRRAADPTPAHVRHHKGEAARRTKRRYAHELYRLAEEGETRPLAVEVPALYAYALGLETWGSGWYDAEPEAKIARIERFLAACRKALLADALLQGLAGQEAWGWADRRSCGDNAGEWAWERAVAYGVNPTRIKPYPCGPEPQTHDHMASTGDVMGFGIVTRVDCPESECPACTEPTAENLASVTPDPQDGHTPAPDGTGLPSEEQNRFSNDVGEDRR